VGYRSYIVYMEVDHQGCWTQLTMSKDVYVRNLRKDLNHSPISYTATSLSAGDDIGAFVGNFRTYRRTLRLRINSYSRGFAILEYEVVKKDTIAEMLGSDPGIVVLGFDVVDGVERWRLLVTRSNREGLGELRDSIGKLGNIQRFQILDPDPGKILDYYPPLSKYEEEALVHAFILGFMDYPRRAKAKDIAKVLGISPATFLYHLRRAEKKLVTNYLKKSYPELLYKVDHQGF